MAIDRSEYQISIKTTADVSSAKAANDAMMELTKTAGQTGEGLDKAGESAHELHEKFHLVKLAAGEALGPIGELGHFLTNPALLGIAAVTLAVKTLIEHLQEAAEQTRKNIESAQAYRDFLEENHHKAMLDAAEDVHRWNLEMEHARDHVDQLGQALQRTCAANEFSTGDAMTFVTVGDSMNSLLEVNDLDAGAITIRAALDSIGALPFSEIGWADEAEGKWCRWYPDENRTPFVDNSDRMRMWLDRFDSVKRKSPSAPTQLPPSAPQL
jgi:hypothetical protein